MKAPSTGPGARGRLSGLGILLLLAGASLYAGQTRTWSQNDYSDFEKGIVRNLSVRSDGLLALAPRTEELFDTPSAYLWALAEDSAGNLYAGGGTGAKLYRIPPKGKGKLLADLDGLEVQALAVDSKDRVYAATAPDGKVYRVSPDGKSEVFYDPKAKYIWALAFDRAGNLFVATGDPAQVHRVAPDGTGKVFYESDETHVRSMTLDPDGNLIVGTEPGGLVVRISPAGQGFVLYQMSKREVTAVAVREGIVYAAAVGNKGALAPSPLRTAAPPSMPQPAATAMGLGGPASPMGAAPRAATPQPVAPVPAGVRGGSEVYAIDRNGTPRRIWSDSDDVVYAIAFDSAGRPILGAGNRGNVYRVESPVLYTALLTVPSTQVTAFHQGRDGRLYAATGNIGKVYEIGPGLEKEGTIESDVFDAGLHSMWGRLSYEARLNGGQVALVTRTGNLDTPRTNWSPWTAPGANGVPQPKGARVNSPSARFVQWKATLTGDGAGHSPDLESVDLAYLPQNLEPRIDEIDLTPPNYRFPAQAVSPLAALLAPSQSLTLPPLGRATAATVRPPVSFETPTTTPAMQFARGYVGARWVASDPNGDGLVYTVEIKGKGETQWKLLKDKVAEKYLSWDSTAFPDGEYTLRITASDSPANPPGQELTARMESDPFIIDNTAPLITGLAATRNGGRLVVRWHAADALNNLHQAEYSLDGGDWTVVAPVGALSDSPDLDYELTLNAPAGEHTLAVRVSDEYDNSGLAKTVVQQ